MSFNATKMLDVWSTEYSKTRKSIEKSKFQRWEFDKCILFNKINYIKRIAKDIHEIVAVGFILISYKSVLLGANIGIKFNLPK